MSGALINFQSRIAREGERNFLIRKSLNEGEREMQSVSDSVQWLYNFNKIAVN